MFFRKSKKRKFFFRAGSAISGGAGSVRSYSKKSSEKKNIFGRILYWLVFLIFIGAIIYTLFFSGFLNIQTIKVDGSEKIDAEKIKQLVRNEISGKYFNLIDKNNFLLASGKKWENKIKEEFKTLEEVKIKKVFPERVEILVQERDFLFIFCSGGPCLMVDKNGEALTIVDLNSDELQREDRIILIDESNREVNFGDEILDKEFLDFILKIKEKIRTSNGLEIETEIKTPRLISGDIIIKTKEGWSIYLNKDIGVDRLMNMLKIVLENKITVEERVNLDYIDLRIDSKVYYKLK